MSVSGGRRPSLSPILGGDLLGWRGLPADLPLDELTAVFPRNSDWSGSAQLGRQHRPATYVWLDLPADDRNLRVWLDDKYVIMLDLTYAGARHAHELPLLFDEQPVTLDTWQETVPLAASELVFVAHGLAAFIDRETDSIWHLAAYTPTTIAIYLDDLRLDFRTRRLPARTS
ncbi:MAG TPA: hypothetical protein VGJ60_13595 [Chloroflexota bacterium]|jgi:hypothetical protein